MGQRQVATETGPATQVSRPTRRVLFLVGGMTLAASAVSVAVLRHPPDPPIGVHIHWYVLTLLFAATEAWVFHIQFGREAKSISISEIPLVIGLFYASPGELLVARIVGPALIVIFYRRQTALKAVFNISLFYADAAVALAAFRIIGGGSVDDSVRTWIAAVAAAVLGIVLDLAVLSVIVHWYTGRNNSALRGSLPGLGMSAASATLGLVAVLTLRMGPLAAIPLLVAGGVLLAFFREYANLSDRHTSLERLFRFSHELSGAPATTEVLPAILSQARQLLRAEVAEVLRFDGGAQERPPTVWRYDANGVSSDSSPEALEALALALPFGTGRDARLLRQSEESSRTFLRSRRAREAVVAPLIVEGDTIGVLAVYDRLGEVRGFEDSDVTLLQTVANHASVALHNETLIGRLRHDALHDTLTGLPNRASLMALAEAAVARSAADGVPLAMMIIDLNGFKSVNDTLGHSVGDQLICEVARRFRDAAGPGVSVARLGGDEFAVLVERTTDQGLAVATRLTDSLLSPLVVDQDRLHLSGSIGIALAPEHATSVGDLLKRADIAMYVAKNGPDTVAVYRPDIDGHDPAVPQPHGRAAGGHRHRRGRHRGGAGARPAHRRAGLGRGAGALAPPGARNAAARFLPGCGRAERADHPAHRAGARPGCRRLRPLAGGRPGDRHLGEHLGALADGPAAAIDRRRSAGSVISCRRTCSPSRSPRASSSATPGARSSCSRSCGPWACDCPSTTSGPATPR